MPFNPKTKYLLLDTHVWIWLMNASPELAHKGYLKIIDKYSFNNNLRLCPISIWELGMLVAKNRLTLPKDVSIWVKDSFKEYGLILEALTIDILLESTKMGDSFHGDPADRLILTTAKTIEASVMTADEKMIAYCKKNRLPVEIIR